MKKKGKRDINTNLLISDATSLLFLLRATTPDHKVFHIIQPFLSFSWFFSVGHFCLRSMFLEQKKRRLFWARELMHFAVTLKKSRKKIVTAALFLEHLDIFPKMSKLTLRLAAPAICSAVSLNSLKKMRLSHFISKKAPTWACTLTKRTKIPKKIVTVFLFDPVFV